MKFRHRFFYAFFRPLVILFNRIKFGYKYKKATDLPENYIVLSNHATDFDPILVASSFPKQMYFVGSEHITRWPVIYKFLKFGFEPIIRYKGTVATSTVMKILRKTRGGGNVCMFAEGVRTWDGVTSPILPSTAQLVKAARCGLVTYKLTGGYFTSPMWSEGGGTRRGELRGEVVGVYIKEQLAAMSDDEVFEIINRDLYEDAYERQLANPKRYKGKRLAERLENLLFICPECNGHGTMSSSGDTVSCTCGHSFRYDEYGMLHGTKFTTVRDFARWQKEKVREDCAEDVIYTAESASLSIIKSGSAMHITDGAMSMSREVLRVGDESFELSKIPNMAMHGKHALVFSTSDGYFEIIPSKNSTTLKFLLLFDAIKEYSNKKIETEL
ncbi:MAG: 1-acyl-sn-glycerol-3-phosphate acyltransferase [Clostridia bacterium]|nr:1-acyl-sn-glycerol-3-phosphate acyltransferase [Clostridia bacterium]